MKYSQTRSKYQDSVVVQESRLLWERSGHPFKENLLQTISNVSKRYDAYSALFWVARSSSYALSNKSRTHNPERATHMRSCNLIPRSHSVVRWQLEIWVRDQRSCHGFFTDQFFFFQNSFSANFEYLLNFTNQ